MQNFRIFTEGRGDVKFLKDYIEELFSITLQHSDFDTLGSWSGYKAGGSVKASIQQNHDDQKATILVPDADNSFENREVEILEDFKNYNIPISLFLFPDNNSGGNIESILAEIAVDRKIMDCYLEYEKCVNSHPKPLNHSRIYSYLDMVLHPNPIIDKIDLRKQENINYKNRDHWNLHHASLIPLKNFLRKTLSF